MIFEILILLSQIENPTMNVVELIMDGSNMNQIMRSFVSHMIIPKLLVSVPLKHVVIENSKKFNGLNYKRWRNNMMFYLTTLNLTKLLINMR